MAISHTLARLTRISFSSSVMIRSAVALSRGSSAMYQRNACESRSARIRQR